MELSLDDILFSVSDDVTVAVPFDDPDVDTSTSIRVSGEGIDSTRESTASLQDSIFGSHEIDWNDVDAGFTQPIVGSEATASIGQDQPQDLYFSFPGQPLQEWEIPAFDEQSSNTAQITNIDDFFIRNGAYRPTIPCSHCARLRLQCLIIQTTSANPNPTKSCSSCVALFRECSLSGRQKRNPSAFETLQPVIGQLHGVSEDGGPMIPDAGQTSQSLSRTMPVSSLSSRRTNTRSVKKTRVLRNWLACHLDNPYPSEEEKTALAKQSGLSRIQVVNWFANTRRRQRMSAQTQENNSTKLFPQGSPMPRSFLSSMSPMERWRNSPPDEEPASASAIENALVSRKTSDASLENVQLGTVDGGTSSTSDDSFLYSNSIFQDASSNSESSCYSHRSTDSANIFSPTARSSAEDRHSASWLKRSRSKSNKDHIFQCTFCSQSFKKKYDWVRHERSVHLPGLDSWVCSVPVPPDQSHQVWRVNESNPECIFCGEVSPSEDHIQSHEFETCAERAVSERTFTRKDHLWQHLHKFHGCRKWPGWSPNLNLLQHRQDKVRSQCGFCQNRMESWEERTKHLAGHFREGKTMAEWTGGCGIEEAGDQVHRIK